MYQDRKGLLIYTFLNFLDKLFVFIIPLSVLFVFKNRTLYNEIEYIYSIAAILVIVLEVGVRQYFFYAYKEANDHEKLVKNVENTFFTLTILYFIISIIISAVYIVINQNIDTLIFYIFIRLIYYRILSFLITYFIIRDTPSRVFFFSLLANLGTIGVIFASKYIVGALKLPYFFVCQFLLVIVMIAYYYIKREKIDIAFMTKYIKEAVLFSWPLLCNLFLFMFINNYGKIYSQNFLSNQDMFQISFAQRICMIIIVTHASALGYFSKTMYMGKKDIIKKAFVQYSVMIFFSVLGVTAILMFLQYYMRYYTVDIITVLIIIHTLLFCYNAYFELFITRINKNKFLLLFSTISSVIFLVIIYAGGENKLFVISVAMVLSVALNIVLILSFLKRIKHP